MSNKLKTNNFLFYRALIIGGATFIVSSVLLFWIVKLENPPCFFSRIDIVSLYLTIPGRLFYLLLAFIRVDVSRFTIMVIFVEISSLYYALFVFLLFLSRKIVFRVLILLSIVGVNGVCGFLLHMLGLQSCA